MVKHQRRSHQRGIHPNELLDDCTSDSESGESPSTPKHSGVPWSAQGVVNGGHIPIPNGHTIHRAASFADFGNQIGQYNMAQAYGHRHTVSGGPHEFHGQAVSGQHPGVQMLHRTGSVPQTYYVTDQSDPGVATMNTNPMTQQYQIPRQPVERLPIEIPYSAPDMTSSVQSSPSSFSASGRSPSAQDGFYTHQPAQAATYALQTASPVEQQQPQSTMVSYPSPIPQQISQQPPVESPQQSMPSQTESQESAPAPPSEQFQQPAAQAETGQWYNNVPYQPPVEVATIGQLPTYGSGVYDPWGPKIEFEDPSMQLPSARIASM